jgi:hypothetical protein
MFYVVVLYLDEHEIIFRGTYNIGELMSYIEKIIVNNNVVVDDDDYSCIRNFLEQNTFKIEQKIFQYKDCEIIVTKHMVTA